MLAGQRPRAAIDSHRVAPRKAVVLDAPREIAASLGVPAQQAQGVERTVCSLVLHDKEVPGVPARRVNAAPRCRAGVRGVRRLLIATVGSPFGVPVTEEDSQLLVGLGFRGGHLAHHHHSLCWILSLVRRWHSAELIGCFLAVRNGLRKSLSGDRRVDYT